MIRLQNVSKDYSLGGEKFHALKGINLEIESGQFWAIIGPSGSGKSTLMHLIGLLEKPSSGKIFVNNQDISRLDDNHLSRLRNEFVGFVFQQFNLINKLTVLENVLLPSIYASNTKIDYRSRAQTLLEKFGIAAKANSYPNKISGGQQQRVAIARALVMSPKLVLADEPTGNLDSKTGREILALLDQLNREEKITVAIVTHDPQIAKQARKTLKIKDGEIEQNT